jgi:hypothetical protein
MQSEASINQNSLVQRSYKLREIESEISQAARGLSQADRCRWGINGSAREFGEGPSR